MDLRVSAKDLIPNHLTMALYNHTEVSLANDLGYAVHELSVALCVTMNRFGEITLSFGLRVCSVTGISWSMLRRCPSPRVIS